MNSVLNYREIANSLTENPNQQYSELLDECIGLLSPVDLHVGGLHFVQEDSHDEIGRAIGSRLEQI